MTVESDDLVRVRRAVEALRSGVPSRHAVETLGCGQPAIETRVRQQLEDAAANGPAKQVPGTLIAGGFGTGKSHLLEYIQHIAIEENFVCSKVVISKETPLYDPVKVYRAAILGAKTPGRAGAALTEIVSTLNVRGQPFQELIEWTQSSESGLHPRFAALTYLLDPARAGQEAREQIVAHLAGDRLGVAPIRAWLREARADAVFQMTPIADRELSLQRFRYVPRLFAAAGYAGWLLLFDEVELIGRYSLQQRTKSYAEIARWLGKPPSKGFPGVTAVLAITSDFAAAVLEPGGKNDLDGIPNRLAARGQAIAANPSRAGRAGRTDEAEIYRLAERGMNAIRRDAIALRQPDKAMRGRTYDLVRALHARAYDWEPPDVDRIEWLGSRPVREYVRSWITEWDLARLYPGYRAQVEVEEVVLSYAEAPELEPPTEEAEDLREDGTSDGDPVS
ncbi:MAG: BREX system ATP-binding domain-containing protein [Dehalococcoidia bacterium]